MESLSQGQREQLEYMGLDREAQAESTLNYIKQQRLLTQGTKEQMNTSSTAVMKYIDETDKLARITGLNRKEQEKLLEKVKAYAKRSDPEISANNMDFSKPVDDASN
jgi:ribosomal protein S18